MRAPTVTFISYFLSIYVVRTAALPAAESGDVTTIIKASQTIQIPPEPTSTPDVRDLGFVNTRLDTLGNLPLPPFPTEDPRAVGTLDPLSSPQSYTTTVTLSGSAQASGLRAFLVGGVDVLTPITTNAPPTLFPRRGTHPVPRPSGQTGPGQTNKFHANMQLGERTNPVFTYPYEVWWNREASAWGLGIDHRDASQRVFGPAEAPSGARRWYSSPIFVQTLQLGAVEFNGGTGKMEMRNASAGSAEVVFSAAQGTGKMEVALCQGMGFVSATYTGLTPVVDSTVLVKSIAGAAFRGSTTAVKYRIVLDNGAVWVLYAFAATGSASLQLEVVNSGHVRAKAKFSGLIQVAKVAATTAGNSAVETVLDAAAGSWCKSVSMSASVAGSIGEYQFNYEKKGSSVSDLLMFALPHHVQSFSAATAALVRSQVRLQSPTKGVMTAVLASQWHLTEPALPTGLGWLPAPVNGARPSFSAAALTRLAAVAAYEMQQDMDSVTNLDTMYFSGKALAKYAHLCLSTSEVLQDLALTRACQIKLKAAFARFAGNRQTNALVYESVWRGVVSDAMYKTGDPLVDFGSGYYNDHHFHYGYFIHTAAIIAYLEKKHFSTTGSWLAANKPWVDTLIRDVANPSTLDTYFPVFRSFDWFHGHSWAKGLFESWDGKDEESSSEDYNFYYAMRQWGVITGDRAMEARGNLLLAILKRSINSYMLLTSTSPANHPPEFMGNKVSGILFENKVEHTTYFGDLPQYIHGVHMLPLTAVSPYMRSAAFVKEEWNVYFEGRTGTVDDGWKGVLYANRAIMEPAKSFNLFADKAWNNKWLDGGASRTWYMVFSGALGGAA